MAEEKSWRHFWTGCLRRSSTQTTYTGSKNEIHMIYASEKQNALRGDFASHHFLYSHTFIRLFFFWKYVPALSSYPILHYDEPDQFWQGGVKEYKMIRQLQSPFIQGAFSQEFLDISWIWSFVNCFILISFSHLTLFWCFTYNYSLLLHLPSLPYNIVSTFLFFLFPILIRSIHAVAATTAKMISDMIANGAMEFNDPQAKRYYAYNERWSRFFQFASVEVIRKILGRPVQISYTYFGECRFRSVMLGSAGLCLRSIRGARRFLSSSFYVRPNLCMTSVLIFPLKQAGMLRAALSLRTRTDLHASTQCLCV